MKHSKGLPAKAIRSSKAQRGQLDDLYFDYFEVCDLTLSDIQAIGH